MNTCQKVTEQILGLAGNEGIINLPKEAQQHIGSCTDCRAFYQLHSDLSKNPIPMPDEAEFRQMRQNVLRQIRIREASRSGRFERVIELLLSLFGRPAFAYALSILFLVSGYWFGVRQNTVPLQGDSSMLHSIQYTAMENKSVDEMQNSPFIFSNVSVRNTGADRVQLNFDVARHIQTERPKDDPLVKEVVAQAILNPQPLGNKLQTIDYSQNVLSPKIKNALILTMQNDNQFSVRLKAAEALQKYPKDSELTNAFMSVLRTDDSVQMRLLAIDYLSRSDIKRDQLLRDIEESGQKNASPLIYQTLKKTSYTPKN